MSPRATQNPGPVGLPIRLHVALARELTRFSPHVKPRGLRYAREGRVGAIVFDGRTLEATVEGTLPYTATWEYGQHRWRGECSCPVGLRCKHLYALALEASTRRLDPLDDAQPRGARQAPTSLAQRVMALETRYDRDALADEIVDRFDDDQRITLASVSRVLDEIEPELRCWRLARLLADARVRGVPEDLLAFATRDDLQLRGEARERSELFGALRSWAMAASRAPAKQLRFELCFDESDGTRRLRTRARMSSARIEDESRNESQLQALLHEADTRSGVLADEERELLRFLLAGGFLSTTRYLYVPATASISDDELVARAAGAEVVRIADDLSPALASRTGLRAGGPIELGPAGARIAPILEVGARGPRLRLRFVLADGSEIPLSRSVVLPTRTRSGFVGNAAALLVANGRFHRVTGAPSLALLARLNSLDSLAIGPGDLPELRSLATVFPPLASSLAPFMRALRVTPIVLLDLDERDFIDARLLAHTGARDWTPAKPTAEGQRVFEAAPGGAWVEMHELVAEEPAARRAFELPEPDPADVEPALRWLGSLRGDPAAAPPWRVRATGESLELLVRAAEEAARAELTVLTTQRLARLLRPSATRARVAVRASGLDFFEIDVTWEDELAALSEADRARLRKPGPAFIRLRSGWIRRDQAERDEELLDQLADLGLSPGDGPRRVGLLELAGARAESLATLERLVVDPEAIAQARALRERIATFAGVPRVPVPAGLMAELRPYQHTGLDFLAYLSSLGVGAVLADDMGLGKTVQALAWLLHLRAREPNGGPALVVCPTSVVHGWAREAARFAPELRVVTLERGHGREARLRDLSQIDLVVTSYALLRLDIARWRELELSCVILDEAQQVKNPDAVASRAARELRARHRLVLTGTPLENRPLDLWSLSEFANPGYLGRRKEFTARYDRTDAPPHVRRLLAARMRPVLLRRLKREVAPELPARIEERRDCELSPEQRKRYALELERAREIAAGLDDSASARSRGRIQVLAALLRLRQIACHPALVGGSRSQRSGKLDALLEVVEPLIAEGHKVLVFSQFVRFLELVDSELTRRGIRSHVLTGATTHRERVVSAFQADPEPCVFLISLKAGGTGLNLTSAHHVVLLDPWWNPAVEAQAIDRTHRIGQDRTVVAFRLVSRGTIEEKVLTLQEAKRALVQDVLGDEAFARSLSREDLAFLLADE